MKLEPEFPQLEVLVKKMDARPLAWRADPLEWEGLGLVSELRTDGRILSAWEDVAITADGLLSFQGYQIVLHIRDVQKDKYTLENEPDERPKYHICDCRTLERMREGGRFDRYVMSSRVDGRFLIDSIDRSRRSREIELPLNVCMNCLEKLDYKGSSRDIDNWAKRRSIRDEFRLAEFFAEHRTRFSQLPRYTDEDAPPSGYSLDWDQVSRKYRKSRRWICEECGVNLSDRGNRGLLHVHHVNGIRSDNYPANLRALCLHCHGKQTAHGRMSAWFAGEWKRIEEIRRAQGVR